MTEPVRVKEDLATTTCASCGLPHEGRYCAACGQRQRVGRLTLKGVTASALREFFDAERGLLHTVSTLFRAPARVAHDFIAGATARYVSPVKYFLLMVTAGQLVAWQLGVLNDIVGGFMEGAGESTGDLTAEQVTDFVTNNLIFLSILAIPGVVLSARLLFRRSGFNLAEILGFYLYVFGHLSLVFVLVAPFASLLPAGPQDAALMLMMVFQLLYFVWATIAFFRSPLPGGIVRAATVAVLSFIAHVGMLTFLMQLLTFW